MDMQVYTGPQSENIVVMPMNDCFYVAYWRKGRCAIGPADSWLIIYL